MREAGNGMAHGAIDNEGEQPAGPNQGQDHQNGDRTDVRRAPRPKQPGHVSEEHQGERENNREKLVAAAGQVIIAVDPSPVNKQNSPHEEAGFTDDKKSPKQDGAGHKGKTQQSDGNRHRAAGEKSMHARSARPAGYDVMDVMKIGVGYASHSPKHRRLRGTPNAPAIGQPSQLYTEPYDDKA